MALNSALKEGLGVWSRQAAHLGLVCLLDAEVSNCAKLLQTRLPQPCFSSSSSRDQVPWALSAIPISKNSTAMFSTHYRSVLIAGWCPSRSLFSWRE